MGERRQGDGIAGGGQDSGPTQAVPDGEPAMPTALEAADVAAASVAHREPRSGEPGRWESEVAGEDLGEGRGEDRGEDRGNGAGSGAKEEDAAEDAESPGRLWDVFRARAISWATMDRRLRLATATAIVEMVVAAMLIAVRGLFGVTPDCLTPGWPACVEVAVQAHQLIAMPTVVFVISLCFLALAWSYLLLGALESRPWVTVVALALFTLSMHQLPDVGAASVALPLLVVAVWVVALAFRWLAAPALRAATVPTDASTDASADSPARIGRADVDPAAVGSAVADAMGDPPLFPAWARRWPGSARAAGLVARVREWDLPLVAFGVVLGLMLSLYGVTWWSAAAIQAQTLFTLDVTVQIEILSIFLIPVLFLAGTDFAEWGEVIAGRVAYLTRQVRAPWALAAATGALVLLSLVSVFIGVARPGDWRLPWESHMALGQIGGPETWPQLGASVALALVAGVLLALAVWRWRVGTSWRRPAPGGPRVPYRLPYAALAVGAVALTGAVLATVLVAAFVVPAPHESPTAPTAVYRHSAREPHFTIAYPTLWEVVPSDESGPDGFTAIIFNGAHASTPAQFSVVAIPASSFQGNPANDVGGVLTAWFRDELHRDVILGTWTGHEPLAFTFDQGTTAYDGQAWERTAHGQVWLLYGYSIPEISPIFAPVFRRMVASWTPTLTPTAAPADQSNWLGDVGVPGLVLGLLPLLIALGLGLPLLRRWRQGRGGPLAAAGLFALVCGALLFGQYLPQVAAVARLPAERVPSLDLAGMRVVVALATLGLLGWMLGRRAPPAADVAEPLAMLFALNGGLLVVALMAALYEGALLVRFGVAQAVIVLLALLWDTTMSGEQVTNVEGRLFPRPARVLLFLGYIMLVSAAVLYFTSWQVQATGAPVAEAIFESELWPREGLLGLGVPLLFVSFTLGLTRWLAQRNLRGEGADTLARGDLVEVAMTMDGEVGVARAPEKT